EAEAPEPMTVPPMTVPPLPVSDRGLGPLAGTGMVDAGVDEGGDDVGSGEVDCACVVWPEAVVRGGGTVRSLWQYRHLIASSWISSAQYGHFFMTDLPRFRAKASLIEITNAVCLRDA